MSLRTYSSSHITTFQLSSHYSHSILALLFFFNDTATTEIYTLSLHDALPISTRRRDVFVFGSVMSPMGVTCCRTWRYPPARSTRSEEHTSELQSRFDLVCRLLLEKKKKNLYNPTIFVSHLM